MALPSQEYILKCTKIIILNYNNIHIMTLLLYFLIK